MFTVNPALIPVSLQEDLSMQRIVAHQDPSVMAAGEVVAPPSPTTPQEQKEEDSKRESVDDE